MVDCLFLMMCGGGRSVFVSLMCDVDVVVDGVLVVKVEKKL